MFKQGEHVFFAFVDGKTVLDSQTRPRMYTSREQYERCYPGFRIQQADLVEYAPVSWISIMRRLPEIPEEKAAEGYVQMQVLVWCDNGRQCAWYQPDDGTFYDKPGWFGEELTGVTHWQPLPPPPGEEETCQS